MVIIIIGKGDYISTVIFHHRDHTYKFKLEFVDILVEKLVSWYGGVSRSVL